jgi:flavin-dependent dehydrogenase
VITCDYLIIGSGIAGIGLKYKLLGKTILIDKDPFRYKIGESQVPDLIHADPGLFSLIPKFINMKSYTRKLGTVFCDSYHGKFASNLYTPLGARFTFHCEREELEKLLVKELSIEIRKETILDIDLAENLVTTDKNTYRFKKYILDCSGPAMVLAKKLGLISPVGGFEGMKAQWSYWAIEGLNEDLDSWAHWTVLNKVGPDSWTWQIPIYNSSVLSMGLLHRGEVMPEEDFLKYAQKHSAACYRLTSIARNPQKAIKPYMKQVHTRLQYSRRSRDCAGKNWILVADAYCFADPVYSVGTAVAMMEAITIADNLNKNSGRFDQAWYEKSCNNLLKAVIGGIGTWYSGAAFDKKVNQKVNRTILRGGFSRYFKPSGITENVKQLQQDTIDAFLPYIDIYSKSVEIKVYYFDRRSFVKTNGLLFIFYGGKKLRVTNDAVRGVLEKNVIGQKLSFHDLYLMAELNLATLKDKAYFWKIIRFVELLKPKEAPAGRMYYFHPEKYEQLRGRLKLGDPKHHLMVKNPVMMEFYEGLKGKILFDHELLKRAGGLGNKFPGAGREMEVFFKTFSTLPTFGQNFCLAAPESRRR